MLKHLTCPLIPAVLVAVALPAVSAPAARATAFPDPDVSASLSAKTVHEPGGLVVTLHTSACVDDVEADTWNAAHGTVARSSVVKAAGRSFKVTLTFTKTAPAGREVIADVFARPCGSTAPGQVALLPVHGSFPGFAVTRG
jgi:hypothetical protein